MLTLVIVKDYNVYIPYTCGILIERFGCAVYTVIEQNISLAID